MDDVAFWTRALTPAEIRLVYAAGYNGKSFADLNLSAGAYATNWVAFNDHSPGTSTAPNVSGYDMMESAPGPLTNYVAAGYPAGQELTARLGAAKAGGTAYSGTMSLPSPGTPAYDLFMPGGSFIVDLANTPNPGILFTAAQVDLVTNILSGLDPNMRYVLRTTSVRGRDTDASPDDRYTVATLGGVEGFVDNQTAGVVTIWNTPAATLTAGQAAWNSGRNQAVGAVVGWDEINPGTDGIITIVSGKYVGPIPGGTASGGAYGYGPCGLMLMELGPLSPLVIISQPAAEVTALQTRPFSLVVRVTGTTPTYQWYKEGVGAIAGATRATYGKAVTQQEDAGYYYLVANNSFGSVTSQTIHVTVELDTTPPTIVSATGNATLNGIYVQFSEVVDETTAADPFAYEVSDANGTIPGFVLSILMTNNGQGVVITTAAQQAGTLYTLACPAVTDLALNGVANTATFQAWVDASQTGGLAFDYFAGISGTAVSVLTSSANYPNNPTARYRMVNGFSSREVFPDDTHEYYGARVYGLFIPPVPGVYRFFLRSDDASELWMNTNGPSPLDKALIAQETACCNTYQAYGNARTSGPIPLTPDKAYYIEALLKEGGGGDYLFVAVRLEGAGVPPDSETIAPGLLGYPNILPGAAGLITITQAPVDLAVDDKQPYTFTVAAENPNSYPMTYQWSRWDAVGSAFTNIPNATAASYTGIASLADDNGARFKVSVAVPGALEEREATLTVTLDSVPPRMLEAHGSPYMDRITVKFSEIMDPTTTQDPFVYSISEGIQVGSVRLAADGMSVVITLDLINGPKLQPNTLYTVSAEAVTDVSSNVIDVAYSSVTFRSFVLSAGFLRFEYYPGGTGTTVDVLTSDPNYPDNPALTTLLHSFNSREVFPDDGHEQYGARMSGCFIPEVSGNYIFFARSDDSSQLFLNPTGTDPAGAVMIAEETGCCGGFSKISSTNLFPNGFDLVAGEAYYIALLYREGGSGDFGQVAVRLKDDPTPPDNLLPIPGINLGCYADPQGVSLAITQQPIDQVNNGGIIMVPGEDFNANDGAFTVTTVGPVGHPWAYNSTRGTWQSWDQSACATAFRYSLLNSPPYGVMTSGPLTLSFVHRYSFEADATELWDGGQVRVSVNGGAYVPVTNFTANGYNGIVGYAGSANNILKGLPGFTGTSTGHGSGTFITSTVTLGTFNAGDNVSVQFVAAYDDCSEGVEPNWEIDSVTYTPTLARALMASTFSVEVAAVVPGYATPPVAFQWQWNRGAGFVDISGATGASYTFFPVTADNGASYRCVVFLPGIEGALVSDTAVLTLPGPSLTIALAGDDIVIAWPANTADAFQLEETSELKNPPASTVWALVTKPVVVVGSMKTVTVPKAEADHKFYRLHR
jgi:hypothetical protein